MILVCGSCMEREKASVETVVRGRRPPKGGERERAEAETVGIEYRSRRSLADRPVVVEKLLLAGVGVERRGRLTRDVQSTNQAWPWEEARRDMPKPDGKSFAIPKQLVWEAWRQVKANKGAPGVDGQDLGEFEADLEGNLYKVWNRSAS